MGVGEVLEVGVVEQELGKSAGRFARLHASRCLADQGCPSLVVTPRHNVLRFWPRRLTADAIVCLILELQFLEHYFLTEIEGVCETFSVEASVALDDNAFQSQKSTSIVRFKLSS